MGDLSLMAGGSHHLKRLNQATEEQNWQDSELSSDVWIEVLQLTGKHKIDMLSVRGTNAKVCYAKYEVDGVELSERDIRSQAHKPLIGFSTGNTGQAGTTSDGPIYAKTSFKVFIKKPVGIIHGMGFKARYSQVVVESME